MFTFVSFSVTALAFYFMFRPLLSGKPKEKLTREQKVKLKSDDQQRKTVASTVSNQGFSPALHPNLYIAQTILYPILIRDWMSPSYIRKMKAGWSYDKDITDSIVEKVKKQAKHGLKWKE